MSAWTSRYVTFARSVLAGKPQLPGQDTLTDPPRCQPRGHDGVRSAFSQPDQAHLREWRGILLASGPAESRVILLCIGNVQHEPVNGHQPAGTQPGTFGTMLRAGNRDPLEQQLQWHGPKPLTRLRDRASGRNMPVLLPCSGKQQARHEKAHHLFICIAEEQAQGQHVIDHDPRRQQPGPLFCPPGFGKHIIDQVTIDKAR